MSEVLDLLNNGKTRPEIAEHFGISMAECRRLFQHPDLKGKRAKTIPEKEFEFIDDREEVAPSSLPQNEEEEPQTAEDPSLTAEDLQAENQEVEVGEEPTESLPNLSWEN